MSVPVSFIISAYKVDIENKRDTGWTWTMILDALRKAGAELPAGFNTQKLALAYKRTERYRIQQRELPDITVDLIAAPAPAPRPQVAARPATPTRPQAAETGRREGYGIPDRSKTEEKEKSLGNSMLDKLAAEGLFFK